MAARERNRRGEGALLRADIVAATLALLDETGDARAVTLRAVARRAGITPPAIYAHFATPEAIVLAVVQEQFAGLRTYLQDEVAAAGRDDCDRLHAWCRAYLAFARERPERYLIMFGGVWNARPAIEGELVDGAEVADLGSDLLDDLAHLVRVHGDTEDPVTDATMLWVALHGLAHQRIVSSAYPWPPDVEDRLVSRLIDG